jgi:hypothetical protein
MPSSIAGKPPVAKRKIWRYALLRMGSVAAP